MEEGERAKNLVVERVWCPWYQDFTDASSAVWSQSEVLYEGAYLRKDIEDVSNLTGSPSLMPTFQNARSPPGEICAVIEVPSQHPGDPRIVEVKHV